MGFISGSGIGSAAPTGGSGISRARLMRAVLAGAVALIALPGAAPVASLELDVDQLRSAKGQLGICLTAEPERFPKCTGEARSARRWVKASEAVVVFEGLPAGTYAVAIIHDENGNRKLDTALGIPREGFGFSRNPTIGFGPPRFAAARFLLPESGSAQRVKMRYLL
jgi:uncharacterized protein (DUF2141 family)